MLYGLSPINGGHPETKSKSSTSGQVIDKGVNILCKSIMVTQIVWLIGIKVTGCTFFPPYSHFPALSRPFPE
jgi:hypothetical protein